MPATEMVQRIRTQKLSALEVMEAHLAQIDRVNPKVNAIVTMVPTEELLAQARAADDDQIKGKKIGTLHGLPIAHKDLVPNTRIRSRFPDV